MDSVDRRPMTAQERLAEKYAAPDAPGMRRPLHHSPLFWGGVILFVAAISIFVFTDALAWMPLHGG